MNNYIPTSTLMNDFGTWVVNKNIEQILKVDAIQLYKAWYDIKRGDAS